MIYSEKGEIMLHYTRRGDISTSTTRSSESSISSLLTYCNWSYSATNHIDMETLKSILKTFNPNYIPYYLRIFNETPYEVISYFLKQHHISKSSIESIYIQLSKLGIRIKYFEL